MQLTSENYYSQEANKEYMSVSGYKDFAGTYGKMPCEFYGMEKLNGRWEDEKSTALLVDRPLDVVTPVTEKIEVADVFYPRQIRNGCHDLQINDSHSRNV